MVQNDESNEMDELDIEDLDPNIDQLDDFPSSNFLTKSNYHHAKFSYYDEKILFSIGSIYLRRFPSSAT